MINVWITTLAFGEYLLWVDPALHGEDVLVYEALSLALRLRDCHHGCPQCRSYHHHSSLMEIGFPAALLGQVHQDQGGRQQLKSMY